MNKQILIGMMYKNQEEEFEIDIFDTICKEKYIGLFIGYYNGNYEFYLEKERDNPYKRTVGFEPLFTGNREDVLDLIKRYVYKRKDIKILNFIG